MIYLQNRTCLNCKKFRLEDTQSGICRVDKTVDYPTKSLEDTCDKWTDSGQQYHIRLGWIEKTLQREKEAS